MSPRRVMTVSAACAVLLAPAVSAAATGSEVRHGAATSTVTGYGAAASNEPQSTPMAQTPRRGRTASYLVNLRTASRADRLAGHRAVTAAGGRVIVAWPEIGVLVVHSTDTGFLAKVRRYAAVASAGATRSVPVRPTPRSTSMTRAEGITMTRERAQWNTSAVGAGRAYAVTRRTSQVTVAVVDSGIDDHHPDLRGAVDTRRSIGCTDAGRPRTGSAAWRATNNLHGTHVAGIVGAVHNRTGIVGVAPGVRLASVKVVDENDMIYPEYAVCGVMSVARAGIKIANHSYYVDPFMFWCSDQPGQAAVKESLRRAFAWSQKKGVINVAAGGNSGLDLTQKRIDDESPTDGPLRVRRINRGCEDIPAELPGVVTVSAVDRAKALAPYSNGGLGVIDVAAPGDAILSTVPGGRYAEESGTSMAAPHVSGVLALLAGKFPKATPGQLVARLEKDARPLPCPKGDRVCRTKNGMTSFYGHGLVNAAAAMR